jgi:hypothetical protein
MPAARKASVVLAAAIVTFVMTLANPAVARAAKACAPGDSGYSSYTVYNTWTAPNGSQQQGTVWGRDCVDGIGDSIKWRVMGTSRWLQGGGGSYVIDWVYVWIEAADGCGTWDDFGPNGIANTWTNQYNTAWHWQPPVQCGAAGLKNDATDAGGQMKKAGQFDHSWTIHWPGYFG